MAFTNVAGRAGFVIEVDKSRLTSGLREAETEVVASTKRMSAAAEQMTARGVSPDRVALAEKYGLTESLNQLAELDTRSKNVLQRMADLGDVEGIRKFGRDAGYATGEFEKLAQAQTMATEGAGRMGGGMLAAAGKASLLGVAVTTAWQASQRAQAALKVTGEEAFTTEGRIRNLGSALVSGDLIGGFEALTKKAHTFEEMGLDVNDLARHMDLLAELSETVGGHFTDIYESAKLATDQMNLMATSARAVGDAERALAENPFAFGPERGGTGGVAAEQENLNPAFQAGTGGTAVGNTVRDSVTSRIRDQRTRLEQELEDAQLEERQAQRAFENLKGTPDGADAYKRLVEARTARIRKQNEILDLADKEAEEAEREREQRLTKAAQAYRNRLQAREQNLRNAYATALQTPGTRDDAKRYRELLDFLVTEGRDPRLDASERAEFRGEAVTLRGQRKQDIEQADERADKEAQERQKTREQRLKNRVAMAELTKKTIADDLKALRDLRDYYRAQARDKKGIWSEAEEARFQYESIETQKKIQDVLKGKSDPDARAATASSLLAEFNRVTREFSSNVMAGATPGTTPATVVVNQNFKAPTPDRHREARMARIAVEASFLG